MHGKWTRQKTVPAAQAATAYPYAGCEASFGKRANRPARIVEKKVIGIPEATINSSEAIASELRPTLQKKESIGRQKLTDFSKLAIVVLAAVVLMLAFLKPRQDLTYPQEELKNKNEAI